MLCSHHHCHPQNSLHFVKLKCIFWLHGVPHMNGIIQYLSFCDWLILTWHNVLKFQPCCSIRQNLILMIILGLTFRYLIHFEFLYMVVLRGLISLFSCWYTFSQEQFVEETVLFPIEWSWHPCQRSTDYIQGLFLGTRVSSIGLYVCLYAIIMLFWHCSFVVSLEIRKCESSSFVLFQDCFGYLMSVEIPYTF